MKQKWSIIRYKKDGVNYIGRIAEMKQEGGDTYYRISGQEDFVSEDELIPLISVGDKIITSNGKAEVASLDGFYFRTTEGRRYRIPSDDFSGDYLNFIIADDVEEETVATEIDPMISIVENYLSTYDINYADKGVSVLCSEWRSNKAALIGRLSKHPNWDAKNLCITTEVRDFRDNSQNGLYDKLRKLYGNCRKAGKRYSDAEVNRYHELYSLKGEKLLDSADAQIFCGINIKAVVGERTARCLRKLFLELGLDQYANYEHDYAEIADSVSPIENKLKLVFSVHPCDYLGMSHGSQWNSCHSLKDRGCYHAGTMSYLMDDVSIVCYTIPLKAEAPYYEVPKISRQMFMLKGNTFLQSRMYPDYDKYPARVGDYRAAFINILDEAEGSKEYSSFNGDTRVYAKSKGDATHYPDYDYSQYQTRIWHVSGEEPEEITIGHNSICLICGRETGHKNSMCCGGDSCSGNVNYNRKQYIGYETIGTRRIEVGGQINPADNNFYAYSQIHVCEVCGSRIFDDGSGNNNHSIDDYADHICDSCYQDYENADEERRKLFYCEGWSEYKCPVFDGDPIEIRGYTYCEAYVEDNFTTCDYCGEYEYNEDLYSVTNHDGLTDYVCEHCYNEHTSTCEDCGEVFYTEDMHEYDGDLFCEDCYQRILDSLEEEYEDEDENDETSEPEISAQVSPELLLSHRGFTIGDTVRITDPGEMYTSYSEWIRRNTTAPYINMEPASGLRSDFMNRTGTIIAIAPHTITYEVSTPGSPANPILLGIDWGGSVLIINEAGVERV